MKQKEGSNFAKALTEPIRVQRIREEKKSEREISSA